MRLSLLGAAADPMLQFAPVLTPLDLPIVRAAESGHLLDPALFGQSPYAQPPRDRAWWKSPPCFGVNPPSLDTLNRVGRSVPPTAPCLNLPNISVFGVF